MFYQISSFEHLLASYNLCKRGKRERDYALEFQKNIEERLFTISSELRSGEWKPKGYTQFYVQDPKRRLINAPDFGDRVVHRALYDTLIPIYEPRFIFDSYACRVNKGTHAGADRLTHFLRSYPNNQPVYCLQGDVKSYFASIDHILLFTVLKKKIRDPEVRDMIWKILDSYHESPGVGIPLGNLTSQLFANIFLNEMDTFVKHELGVKHYIRYMDDFILLSHEKEQLWYQYEGICNKLKSMKLLMHPKKHSIYPTARGVDFLGYVVFRNYRRIRNRNIHRVYDRLERISRGTFDKDPIASINSWFGYSIHADAYHLNKSLVKQYPYLSEVSRIKEHLSGL